MGFLFFGSAPPPPLTPDEINECRGLSREAIERGMAVFENPDPDAFKDPQGANFFSCGLCHGLYAEESQDPFVRPGHTLLNAVLRPSWKAGRVDNFVGAANVCRTDWMATDPWQESDPEFQDLVAFLKSVETDETAPALEFQIVPPAATGPSSGDGEAGCRLFNRSCSICHQEGGVGGGDPPLAVSLVEPVITTLDDPDYIRRRIRLSGPPSDATVYQYPSGVDRSDSISVMPFWSADKLSDQEVEDLVAFVALARAEARAGNTTFECPDEPPPPPEGEVLRRGNLIRRQHQVGGIVEELDTRKIRIREFNYDGGGIIVRVWLYSSTGNIRDGEAIGPDLRGMPQTNSTLVVDIPEVIAPGSYDSVSIWCQSARTSFGDCRLEPVTP